MGDQQILVRTRAVVFDAEGRLLVQRHAGPTPTFYRLPGGGIRVREKAEDCVVREVKEESGLDVTAVRLLWVRDFLEDGPYCSLELFFLVTVTGGVFAPSPEGDRIDLTFMRLEELETQVFYPQALLPKLKRLRENRDWADPNPYLRSVN